MNKYINETIGWLLLGTTLFCHYHSARLGICKENCRVKWRCWVLFINKKPFRNAYFGRFEIYRVISSDRNDIGCYVKQSKTFAKRLFDWGTPLFFQRDRMGMYPNYGRSMADRHNASSFRRIWQRKNAFSLSQEMKTFIGWFNGEQNLGSVPKTGISHLWFITIHFILLKMEMAELREP